MSYVSVSPGLGATPSITKAGAALAPRAPIAARVVPRPSPAPSSEPAPGRVVVPPPAAASTPADQAFAKAFVDKLIAAASQGQIDEDPAGLQKLLSLTKDQLKSVVEQLEKLGKRGSAAARAAFDLTVTETAAAADKDAKRKTMMIVGGIAVAGVIAFLVFRKKG